MRETGFLQVDVEYDFLRARRHQVLAALAHRLRRWRGDGDRLVPLDEVADPASWRGCLPCAQRGCRPTSLPPSPNRAS
jgi:hypothetical protein